ncbi:MAG: ComF family protein [Pyrinomonadaceae bacterium]|nr:ComF family protein [Pyrinomonadaceae bacterium]
MRNAKFLHDNFNQMYDAALAVLYPQACAVCGASVERRNDAPACASCWNKTRLFSDETLLCWKCGAPGRGEAAEKDRTSVRCGRCVDESFTAARAIGVYEEALRAAVLELKRKPFVAARLADLLFKIQRRSPLNSATRVVPVPLARERERERGFNQSAVLGRSLAARCKLICDEWSLIRTTHTSHHRAGMDRQGRRETVENAFAVQRPRLIEGERVLLIDDVLTTGATVSSCADALLDAGARDIFVLTIARASSD